MISINGVDCYGELHDDSNMELRFEDEEHDFIWITRDPNILVGWKEITRYWKRYAKRYNTEILEIETDG